MIGNDVIDLEIARAARKSENSRYMAKVFTKMEQALILNSEDPELMLWLLWAMKEAAYKANQRIFDLPRKLNPISYNCDLNLSKGSGKVIVDHSTYDIEFKITSEYIHTTTASGKIFQKVSVCKNGSALDLFDNDAPLNVEAYIQKKDRNGVPSFHSKNTSDSIPFSISHHGKFTAFAIPLINS